MSRCERVVTEEGEPTHLRFNCPGCGKRHVIRVSGDEQPRWGWNGSMDRPTFTSSILFRMPPIVECCHSFVTDGRIQFLSDCSHALAGQMVDLPEIEENA